jgi:hypothetical protein
MGSVILLKNGSPTLTFTPRAASAMIGKSVPTSTVKVKAVSIRLLSRNTVSREATLSSFPSLASASELPATSANDTSSVSAIATRKYIPIGPSPKACTDESTPERVRKVPRIVSANVATIRFRFHSLSIPRRSCTITECRKAVAVSHGMNDAFSTGSHAQYPPQPSTSYDHHIPAMIAAVRKAHAPNVQRRDRRIQSSVATSPAAIAPTAKANGTVSPT